MISLIQGRHDGALLEHNDDDDDDDNDDDGGELKGTGWIWGLRD